MDKLYLLHGQTCQNILYGELDHQPLRLFRDYREAENTLIKTARLSFYPADLRRCQYYNDGTLKSIYSLASDHPTVLTITELRFDISPLNPNPDKAWVIFGTLDSEHFEHEPFHTAYSDPLDASLDMMREAYFAFENLNVPNKNILYYANGCAGLEHYANDVVNKIFDGENWKVELRLVQMHIC